MKNKKKKKIGKMSAFASHTFHPIILGLCRCKNAKLRVCMWANVWMNAAIAGIHDSWRLILLRPERGEVDGSFGRRQIGFGSSCNIDICLHSHSLFCSLFFIYLPRVCTYGQQIDSKQDVAREKIWTKIWATIVLVEGEHTKIHIRCNGKKMPSFYISLK